jgi:glutamyl-tRNA reductase
MIDIAVPRDIESEVGLLDDIYLYTVDDMQEIIQEGLRTRQQAAEQAEEIIDTQVLHFMNWLQSLGAVSTIRAVRDKAEIHREVELQRAKALLAAGKNPDEVLQQFAHRLTNKFIHTPSVQLKQAGYDGHNEIFEVARVLFGLNKDSDA